MKVIKRIGMILILILFFLLTTCEPSEPKGDLTPYMSDVVYIPSRVSAKGKPKKSKKKSLIYLGTYTVTAYCGCSECSGNWGGTQTATGCKTKAGRTIAVDPKDIAYGSEVIIGGHTYVAEDCGGAIKGKRIDIYFDSHSEALDFGRQRLKVYKRGGDRWQQKKLTSKRLKNTSSMLVGGKLNSLRMHILKLASLTF